MERVLLRVAQSAARFSRRLFVVGNGRGDHGRVLPGVALCRLADGAVLAVGHVRGGAERRHPPLGRVNSLSQVRRSQVVKSKTSTVEVFDLTTCDFLT